MATELSSSQTPFPAFAALLNGLTEYTKSTGCRFRLSDWASDADASDGSYKLVHDHLDRLTNQDPDLNTDLRVAFRICESEGLRNVMIATCKELGLWPPSSDDRLHSIAYSDMTEPLDAIAWALWNHDQCLRQSPDSWEVHQRLCSVSSFLLDFAHAAGLPFPTSPETSAQLTQFLKRATEWTQTADSVTKRPQLKKLIVNQLQSFADQKFVGEIDGWLDRNWDTAVTVGAVALVAGIALAAAAIASKSKNS